MWGFPTEDWSTVTTVMLALVSPFIVPVVMIGVVVVVVGVRSTRNVDEDNETRQHAAERSVDLAQAIAITQESAIWFLVGNGGNGLWRLLLGVI